MSEYRDALICAMQGDLELLKVTLTARPELLFQITVSKRFRLRYGLFDEVARASSNTSVVAELGRQVISHYANFGAADFLVPLVLACYAEMHVWDVRHAKTALDLIRCIPESTNAWTIRSLQHRWVSTIDSVIGLYASGRLQNSDRHVPYIDTLRDHVDVGIALVSKSSDVSVPMGEAAACLVAMLKAVVQRSLASESCKVKRLSDHAELLFERLCTMASNKNQLAVLLRSCCDSIVLRIGMDSLDHLNRALCPSCLKYAPVVVPQHLVYQLCSRLVYGFGNLKRNLATVCKIAVSHPDLMLIESPTGMTGHCVVVSRFAPLNYTWAVPEMFECLKTILSLAPMHSLLATSPEGMTAWLHLFRSASRYGANIFDATKLRAHDALVKELLATKFAMTAIVTAPPGTAIMPVLGFLTQAGMLASASFLMKNAFRRKDKNMFLQTLPRWVGKELLHAEESRNCGLQEFRNAAESLSLLGPTSGWFHSQRHLDAHHSAFVLTFLLSCERMCNETTVFPPALPNLPIEMQLLILAHCRVIDMCG